jgi:hypothetical protein
VERKTILWSSLSGSSRRISSRIWDRAIARPMKSSVPASGKPPPWGRTAGCSDRRALRPRPAPVGAPVRRDDGFGRAGGRGAKPRPSRPGLRPGGHPSPPSTPAPAPDQAPPRPCSLSAVPVHRARRGKMRLLDCRWQPVYTGTGVTWPASGREVQTVRKPPCPPPVFGLALPAGSGPVLPGTASGEPAANDRASKRRAALLDQKTSPTREGSGE